MPAPRAPFLRFHENFVQAENGCWNWTGRTGNSGYGQFKVFGEMVSAHRFAHTLYKGPIPDGMHVLHSCDNKLCVNPDHLRAGTRQENAGEARERGRYLSGDRHPLFGKPGGKKRTAVAVRVLGCEYESQNAAEKALGLGAGTVRFWILKHPNKAQIIPKDQAQW